MGRKKKKIVIILLFVLLTLLIIYLKLLLPAKKQTSESSVCKPYTNWMSEPNKEDDKTPEEDGVIIFKQ